MAQRKSTPYAASEGTQDDRAVKIIAAYGAAKSARANVDTTFRDIERLVLPSMEGSNTDNRKAEGQDQRPVSSVATSEAVTPTRIATLRYVLHLMMTVTR
jgi:hypothetical protein